VLSVVRADEMTALKCPGNQVLELSRPKADRQETDGRVSVTGKLTRGQPKPASDNPGPGGLFKTARPQQEREEMRRDMGEGPVIALAASSLSDNSLIARESLHRTASVEGRSLGGPCRQRCARSPPRSRAMCGGPRGNGRRTGEGARRIRVLFSGAGRVGRARVIPLRGGPLVTRSRTAGRRSPSCGR
jgi:hypothetical protein